MARRWRPVLLATLCTAVLGGCSSGSDVDEGPAAGVKPGGPAALGELRAQANDLLGGGVPAFRTRLARLRGYPIVVNQWASWCEPCKEEFPFFQRLARKYEGKVAFLGVNSLDNRDNALEFLEDFPTPFPHYEDPDGDVNRVFRGGRGFPTTAFYDRSGELQSTHVGAYASESTLDQDIRAQAIAG